MHPTRRRACTGRVAFPTAACIRRASGWFGSCIRTEYAQYTSLLDVRNVGLPPVSDVEPAPEDGPAVTSMRTRRRANVGKMEHTRYQGQQSLGTYCSLVPRSALFPVIVERAEKEVDQ